MSLLYSVGLRLYYCLAFLSAQFSNKARLWVRGRNSWKKLSISNKNLYWMHCASAGEFEQGLPLIQAIQEKEPGISWLVSFYSPSGYEVYKNSNIVDAVCYLPLDIKSNVRAFLNRFEPTKVIFIKSEIWPNFWRALKLRKIPFYLVAASFTENHRVFKSSGVFWKKLLDLPECIFTQDVLSCSKLQDMQLATRIVNSGNPRIDRVLEIRKKFFKDEVMEQFTSSCLTLCIGSSWPEDIRVIAEWARRSADNVKIIIAPHDISASMIDRQMTILGLKFQKYSEYSLDAEDCRILVLDTIGILSRIYRYADLSYIGGGFGAGIHNILEPSVYGLGVIFGPKYKHFPEAVDLLKLGTAITINHGNEMAGAVKKLFNEREMTTKKQIEYFALHAGAAEKTAETILSE